MSEVLKAKPIDKVLFTAQYDLSFVGDTAHEDKHIDETMMLKVGSKSSLFYSYARFRMDSLIEMDKATGASQEIIQEHMKQGTSQVNYQIFKNYPEGKLTQLEPIAASNFRSEEKTEIPVWELHPDTATFLAYTCYRATCRFRGRNYEAWYTPEIPRSEGPWKLQGLPGLILKASDSRQHYTFVCTGIEKAGKEEAILFIGSEYEPISRKDLLRIHERFAADPIGYLKETSPGMQIIVKGEDGQPMHPKNTPYNPIEKE
jgi:GLPGLI family protein